MLKRETAAGGPRSRDLWRRGAPTRVLLSAALAAATGFAALPAVPPAAKADPAVPATAQTRVPIPGLNLSATDYSTTVTALEAARKDDWTSVAMLAPNISDPTARKILEWLRLQARDGGASHAEILRFLQDNPDWPRRSRLLGQAERALIDEGPSDDQAIAWFEVNPPHTGEGKIRYGDALIAMGETDRGKALIRRGWIEHDFESVREREILKEYSGVLRREDHIARLDRLLWDKDATDARMMARQVGAEYQALADARLSLATRSAGVDAAVSRVPSNLLTDPGLLFERARWRRRAGLDNEVVPLLLKAPATAEEMVRPDEWWTERHIQARRLIKERDYQTAYDLARNHGMSAGVDFAEGEWLAGWIALRFLNDPTRAFFHFRTLLAGVTTPISQARAAYWAGRAAEADGRKDEAAFYYQRAAEHDTTYYGQMARQSLIGGDPTLRVEPVGGDGTAPQRFDTSDAVSAMKMLQALGEERLVTSFFYHLAEYLEGRPDLEKLAAWLNNAGRPNLAIRTAKIAAQRGIVMPDAAYPVAAVPNAASAGTPVERALVFGISRQESEFDPQAVSRAGARGLMQLMPGTAKLTADKYNLPYSKDRLLTDPAYNAQIGTTHLGDLLNDFNGSYVLTIAAYNAGSHRVAEWIGTYGDPRTPGVDPIDWVEQIPFSETRNYVQRVLENTQVYRSRLSGKPAPVDLIGDLYRAASKPPATPAAVPVLPANRSEAPEVPDTPGKPPVRPASVMPAPTTPTPKPEAPPVVAMAPIGPETAPLRMVNGIPLPRPNPQRVASLAEPGHME